MQSQLVDLDVTFLDFQNVVRHQISGFEEQAYSFDFKGEYYLLPANSIPSVIHYYENEVKIVRDEIEHWSNALTYRVSKDSGNVIVVMLVQ